MKLAPNIEISWDDVAYAEVHERETRVRRIQNAVRPAGAVACEECDAEIPAARRKAAPFATRCLHCQELHERGRR